MTYTVAVRAMCEFTAKAGDLDLRFTPAPSSQEGIVGHGIVTSRRDDGYEREIALTGEHGGVSVRGRADGYDPVLNRLEEIKTYRGGLNRMPANHRALPWAQARVYGHLLCKMRDLANLTVAIVYYDVDSQRESVLTETHGADSLRDWFESQCERFAAFAAGEAAHRAARDAALRVLPFPHGAFRSGQRALAADVYRAARDDRALIAQAPTGIGKTVGALFPMLRACGDGYLDRVLFLTAKTPGRALALDALELLRVEHRAAQAAGVDAASQPADAPILPLRTLELVARDKACEHPDRACHGESCPLASGFFDRLDGARGDALARYRLDRATVREIALAHD